MGHVHIKTVPYEDCRGNVHFVQFCPTPTVQPASQAAQCVEGQQPGNQGTWFQLLLRYLRLHPAVSWSFYALNGTNSNNCWADNGLLNAGWDAISNLELQAGLRRLQPSPTTLPSSTFAPLTPGITTHRAPRSPSSPLCPLP